MSVDVFALILSFTGVWLNAHKKIWCWWVWMLADILWWIYGFITGQYTIAILHTGYFLSNIYGLYRWRKSSERDFEASTG